MRNYSKNVKPIKSIKEDIPDNIVKNVLGVFDAIRDSIAAEDFDLKAAYLAQTWLDDNKPVIIKYASEADFNEVYVDLDNYIDKRL